MKDKVELHNRVKGINESDIENLSYSDFDYFYFKSSNYDNLLSKNMQSYYEILRMLYSLSITIKLFTENDFDSFSSFKPIIIYDDKVYLIREHLNNYIKNRDKSTRAISMATLNRFFDNHFDSSLKVVIINRLIDLK